MVWDFSFSEVFSLRVMKLQQLQDNFQLVLFLATTTEWIAGLNTLQNSHFYQSGAEEDFLSIHL